MLATIIAALLVQGTTDALTAAPEILKEDPYAGCVCDASPPSAEIVEIDGIVRDAELRAGPDGRSVLPEQATVFTVISASDSTIKGVARVYHQTRPADCGLAFEYGKRYRVRALREGERLTSSYCLDPRRGASR